MNVDTNILGIFTVGIVVLLALPMYLLYWAYEKRKQFQKEIEKQFGMMQMMLDSQETLENMIALCQKQLDENTAESDELLLRKFKETKQSPFWILYRGKMELCKKQNIEVQEEIFVEREELLGTIEMISLLGNVLDNAMEACMGLEVAERKINILLKQEMNLFLLEVTNTKKKSLVLARTGMSTNKSDHLLHGYGVSIIKEIVKRHQGKIYAKDREDEFFLRIFLQL